jgi:hypothetical protein
LAEADRQALVHHGLPALMVFWFYFNN